MTIKSTNNHRPFLIRRGIVLLALLVAYVALHFSDSLLVMVATYFCTVTLLDGLSCYCLKLKSSDYADPKQLIAVNTATLDQLDAYSDQRRKIRFASLGVALLVGVSLLVGASVYPFSPYFVEAFCLAYAITTVVGLGILKPHIRKAPSRIIQRDDQYYVPGKGLSPGYVSPAFYAAGQQQGHTYGPIGT